MRTPSLALVIVGSFALVGCDMQKANKIVTETNTIVEGANASFKRGEEAIQAALNKQSDPEAAAAAAAPCTDALADAATKYAKASQNLLEAGAISGISKEFAEYLKAMGGSHQKSAELMELEQKVCKSFVDKSPTAVPDWQATQVDIDRVRKELNEVQAKADKIQSDNPDKFQK